ncbi:nucleoside triphosphate pyrophosphohydrolase family protein [Sphaerospermopsis sp. LEGE 08334]|uniref:nucleoside triphosphate pyrophosphohydrolase family protein n=1 Tax=Sphaerospermopsis sp. LEGE 08334 TaxID=1828651 RepID=UPI001882DAE2|nr:nucleoside triphosphate pyrophosphohydrolase family protein [Sphaerospermopsis sp. LEGE 08334]MBE9059300.1 nucleoside triphosphate pyrophosphohydrolase family protein [Sphaerospermopsis sp. LEGE 08334]
MTELQQHLEFLKQYSSEYELSDITELAVLALGLAGETGEAIEIIKKLIRDNNAIVVNELITQSLIKELGDILAYVLLIGNYFDIAPAEIIKTNRQKLEKRLNNGTIRGSGNDR